MRSIPITRVHHAASIAYPLERPRQHVVTQPDQHPQAHFPGGLGTLDPFRRNGCSLWRETTGKWVDPGRISREAADQEGGVQIGSWIKHSFRDLDPV
jgi:hypothetical protein